MLLVNVNPCLDVLMYLKELTMARVFIVNFEHISHLFLVFLLLILDK